jgi:hypothetical protein
MAGQISQIFGCHSMSANADWGEVICSWGLPWQIELLHEILFAVAGKEYFTMKPWKVLWKSIPRKYPIQTKVRN